MHRALIIRLGEALQDDLGRVQREYAAREASDTLGAVRARFVDAPPGGVGNLTNPVEILRENLERELLAKLTELLRIEPGAGADFVLDTYLLLNLGEPLVANAASVVIDMLAELVDVHFRAIFPRHHTGSLRRFRIIPIALLPAGGDCKTKRGDAIEELGALHDTFVARREASTTSPVDRVFLLDAMTSRGIATLGDLTTQTSNLLRLVLFGGVRRSVDFVQLFESECRDLFATFGVAACEVDFVAVRDALAARMSTRIAQVFAEAGDASLPSPAQLLPQAVLRDATIRERTIEELRALPLRILALEGSGALRPLASLYDELAQRVEALRVAAERGDVGSGAAPVSSNSVSGTGPRAAAWGAASGLLLGLIVFAVAHYALLITIAASVATGGAFAVLAFAGVALVVRGAAETAVEPKPAESTTEAEGLDPLVDVLRSEIASQRSRLRAQTACLDGITAFFGGPRPDESKPLADKAFRCSLVSPDLMQLLYERSASDDDVRSLADRFLAGVGSWGQLLEGDAKPDAGALDEFCHEHFLELGGQPLFADGDHRSCIADTLVGFLDTWRQGISGFLEGESRKQFDPDGFRIVFSSSVFAPAELAAEAAARIRETGSALEVRTPSLRTDDVFVLSATLDIHPDAVAPLADRRNLSR